MEEWTNVRVFLVNCWISQLLKILVLRYTVIPMNPTSIAMKIKGQNQGDIEGDLIQARREGYISKP